MPSSAHSPDKAKYSTRAPYHLATKFGCQVLERSESFSVGETEKGRETWTLCYPIRTPIQIATLRFPGGEMSLENGLQWQSCFSVCFFAVHARAQKERVVRTRRANFDQRSSHHNQHFLRQQAAFRRWVDLRRELCPSRDGWRIVVPRSGSPVRTERRPGLAFADQPRVGQLPVLFCYSRGATEFLFWIRSLSLGKRWWRIGVISVEALPSPRTRREPPPVSSKQVWDWM